MEQKTRVDVIVPCRNEVHFIESFLDSVDSQDYEKDLWRVIIADGNSDDGTRNILESATHKFKWLKVIENKKRTTPHALNLMIAITDADYIVRLDVHTTYPKNYVSTLIHYAIKLNADNVGCPIRTLPSSGTLTGKAIAWALTHPFGVGQSSFRRDVYTTPTLVNTVPFGCYKKSTFDKLGVFDVELTRGQDAEFNQRLYQNGGKIYMVPGMSIDYFARDTYSKLFKMCYQYGLFRPLILKKTKQVGSVRQLVPLVWVISLLLSLLLTLLNSNFIYLFGLSLFSYLSINILIATLGLKRKVIPLLPFVSLAFVTLHLSYGLGYIIGLLKISIPSLFGTHAAKLNTNR